MRTPKISNAIRELVSRSWVSVDAFTAVLDAFGVLPKKGQYDLYLALVMAPFTWMAAIVATEASTLSERRKRYNRIASTARTLALLIRNPDNPKGHVKLGSKYLSHLLRGADAPGGVDVDNPHMELLISFLSTMEKEAKRSADRCAEEIKERKSLKGAHSRREKTPEGAMISYLLDVYADLRERYPKSGPSVGWTDGGPVQRFLLAALRIVAPKSKLINPDSNDTDPPDPTTQLRGAFNRWKDVARTKIKKE